MATAIPYVVMAISAAGAVYSAQQQSHAQEHIADVDEANATATRRQAAAEEEAKRRKNALIMGDVRASATETGFAPGGGSLLTLQTKTAGELELDALTTRYRGEMEALGLQTDAETQRYNAKSTRTTGYLNAAGYVAKAGGSYYAGSKIDQPSAYDPRAGIRGQRGYG